MATSAARTVVQEAPRPSRMRLASVVKGRISQPMRVVLYSPEGCGKTTFAANAPSPIFLGAEDGTAQLDVERFPTPQEWGDVFDAIRELETAEHQYKTLAVDTLDWIEPMVWDFVCQKFGASSIEEVGGGYGKGYQASLDEWRRFLAAIERMGKARNMHVLLLAHSVIRPFKNPAGPDFDRYEMKLNQKASGLIKEWAEAVLFANWETFAKKDERTKKVKGVSSGARLIYTERTASWDAKNRYSLPEELPLSWADFEAAVNAGAVASPENLKSEIQRKAVELGGDYPTKVAELLAKAGDNPQSLALINNRLNAKLAERAEVIQ